MMIKSNDFSTRFILRNVGEDGLGYIDNYLTDLLARNFVGFKNEEEISVFKSTLSDLTVGDTDFIRYYTGYSFKYINNILRDTMNYYENGFVSDETKQEYKTIADKISKVIENIGGLDFNSYRGVDIRAFRNFGVSTIEDLLSLKGQFIYDAGFISTALVRDRSFFDRELEALIYCNIGIEYFIPGDNGDGIALIGDFLSYTPGQTEYLINKGSLSKVIDVSIDKEKNTAHIKMVYIPKKVWDKEYSRNRNVSVTR